MLANKQTYIHILSLVLSFLLALSAAVTLAVFAINTTVSQPYYMKNKIASSNFAAKASAELEEVFSSYGAASGFEIDVFAPLLDENKIAEDMNLTIDNIYNETPGPSQEEAKRLVFTALVENVNDRNIVLTKDIQSGIEELAKTCAFDYVNKVSLPYLDYITKVISKINEMVNKFKLFMWGGMLIIAACILYVNKLSHRCYRYFSYSCGAVFLVLAVIPAIVLISDKLSYISISPVSLNHFFVDYVSGIFKVMLSMASGALILSVLCAGCYYAFRSKKLKRAH